MKATELQLRDYVNGVLGVMIVSKLSDFLITGIRTGEDGLLHETECRAEYVSPIPLTAEILKANGFISLNYDSCFVYRTSFEEDFEITKDNKGFHLRPVSIAKTNYVHELQHALRLCNLHELANNFKLPQP